MATFTIDLLTGNLYLFSGDFSGSGSTPTSGSTYPAVNLYSDLPTPASSYSGQVYLVRNGSGAYILNRKDAGLYFSDGISWKGMPLIPPYFSSDNFQVYDSAVNSKGISFITSGITSGFKKLKIQNSDGTIAYLTDLQSKVDTSVFNYYTGITAPNTYLTKITFATYSGTTIPANYYNKAQINSYTGTTNTKINNKLDKSTFATYTGTTVPANYYNKSQINSYTGATLLLIQAKQNALIAGPGISIIGSTISATGGTSSSAIQLLDISGGTDVNTISATTIDWTTQVFTGTSLSFTGGSRIYVKANGIYEISYSVNAKNNNGSPKNVGTLIRKNGNVDITPMSSSSFNQNANNNISTNTMPPYLVSLSNGNYVQLVAFRIGITGESYTKPNGSWIKIKKII
jgi:hypothetical protein